MYKIIKITAIITSVLLNILFGFFYLKMFVYEMGRQSVMTEVNMAIQSGQLIINNQINDEQAL